MNDRDDRILMDLNSMDDNTANYQIRKKTVVYKITHMLRSPNSSRYRSRYQSRCPSRYVGSSPLRETSQGKRASNPSRYSEYDGQGAFIQTLTPAETQAINLGHRLLEAIRNLDNAKVKRILADFSKIPILTKREELTNVLVNTINRGYENGAYIKFVPELIKAGADPDEAERISELQQQRRLEWLRYPERFLM